MIDWMVDFIFEIGQNLMHILPTSPFRDFIDSFQIPTYVGWLNWFFPIRECLTVMTVWLSAVVLFYAYSTIMRWVKIISG